MHSHKELDRTILLLQASFILEEQIWQRTMNMCANLLSCFRCSENAYDWYRRSILSLRRPTDSVELRIKLRRRGLVVVDAIEAETEGKWASHSRYQRLYVEEKRYSSYCTAGDSQDGIQLVARVVDTSFGKLITSQREVRWTRESLSRHLI